jgi:hypothetical protein
MLKQVGTDLVYQAVGLVTGRKIRLKIMINRILPA